MAEAEPDRAKEAGRQAEPDRAKEASLQVGRVDDVASCTSIEVKGKSPDYWNHECSRSNEQEMRHEYSESCCRSHECGKSDEPEVRHQTSEMMRHEHSMARSSTPGKCRSHECSKSDEPEMRHEVSDMIRHTSARTSTSGKENSNGTTDTWKSFLSSTTMSEEVMRGVPLSRLLCHRTLPWRTGPSNLASQSMGLLWSLSSPVGEIDWFLSHAWSAPGWMKYIQLVLRNGTVHGLVAALAMLLVLVLLLVQEVLPPMTSSISMVFFKEMAGDTRFGMWCTLLVPAAGLSVAFSSPFLPRKCGVDPVVFLDVVCISQTDEDLKVAGIKALSLILHRSKELHVMWSPDYFSRLWCVYELAAFLRVGGGHLRFRPIFMEAAIFLWTIFNWLAGTLIMLVMIIRSQTDTGAVDPPTFEIGVYRVFLVFCMHLLRRHMRDKQALTHQLKVFDVFEAKCREERDRKHILQSIQRWYGSEEGFNEHVRGEVRRKLERDTQATAVPYCMALISTSGVPLCMALDVFLGKVAAGIPTMDLLHLLLHITNDLCFVCPTLTRLFFLLAERSSVKCDHCICDFAVSCLVFLPWAGLAAAVRITELLLITHEASNIYVSLCWAATSAALTCVVFSKSCRRCGTPALAKGDSQLPEAPADGLPPS